jgi:hypothetical protein
MVGIDPHRSINSPALPCQCHTPEGSTAGSGMLKRQDARRAAPPTHDHKIARNSGTLSPHRHLHNRPPDLRQAVGDGQRVRGAGLRVTRKAGISSAPASTTRFGQGRPVNTGSRWPDAPARYAVTPRGLFVDWSPLLFQLRFVIIEAVELSSCRMENQHESQGEYCERDGQHEKNHYRRADRFDCAD